jgi:hypothetical protein
MLGEWCPSGGRSIIPNNGARNRFQRGSSLWSRDYVPVRTIKYSDLKETEILSNENFCFGFND